MGVRDQILSLLRSGESFQTASRRLGIPAGRAYMIATGWPADGSDSLGAEDYRREGIRLGGSQDLLGVPHHNPSDPEDKAEVMAWVRDRARAGLRHDRAKEDQ